MGDLTNNPVLSMTKGLNKILAGFNPDGTAKFAFTQHDTNPTVGTLLFPDIVITPKNGTIDELGNVYNNIGGTRYMTAPSGRRYNIGEIPVSNVDPLAKFYVEGTALAPAFNLARKTSKFLYNNGKIILKSIPHNPNNFYRAVDRNAIDDAIKSEVIRGRNSRSDNYAFFGRSSEPYHNTKYVIEGTPESADWISTYKYVYNKNPEIVRLPKVPDRDYSKAYDTIIGTPESNGFLKVGAFDLEFLEGYEALPMTNGKLNISPSSNFTYWKKYPIIGWRLHNFKKGGQIVKDFKLKFLKKK